MTNPSKRKKVPQDTKKVRKVFHGFVYATMEIDWPIKGMFIKNMLSVRLEPTTFGPRGI